MERERGRYVEWHGTQERSEEREREGTPKIYKVDSTLRAHMMKYYDYLVPT